MTQRRAANVGRSCGGSELFAGAPRFRTLAYERVGPAAGPDAQRRSRPLVSRRSIDSAVTIAELTSPRDVLEGASAALGPR